MNKKLLSPIGFGLLLCTLLPAFAEPPIFAPQTLSTTATCAASAATNVALVIDCRKQASVAVQVTTTNTVAGAGAGAASYSLYYGRSVDGTTYDTTYLQAASPAPNGLTAITWTTNLLTQGCGYIKIFFVTNAMQASTNLGYISLSYGTKIQAP